MDHGAGDDYRYYDGGTGDELRALQKRVQDLTSWAERHGYLPPESRRNQYVVNCTCSKCVPTAEKAP